jgi:uncharacterized protein YndB with AHSA1/START domain
MTPYKIKKEISIHANSAKVWEALTNPEIIKKYLFGTQTISDWKVDSYIIFKGEYDGNTYTDKGTIKQFEKEKVFQYSYLSSFSGIEDTPENYHLITYMIHGDGDVSKLIVTQENIHSQEAMEHAGNMWDMVLEMIKAEAEKI